MQANATLLSKGDDGNAEESTPLLPSSSSSTQGFDAKNWTKLRVFTSAGLGFRRVETYVKSKEQDSNVPVEPAQALTPLVAGGIIQTTDGATLAPWRRPRPIVKSVPTAHPSRRRARHKSHFLNNLNNFRHMYKNTRLAVKFGGMAAMANASWDKMASLSPLHRKDCRKMQKLMKRLGQGGSMRLVLGWLEPFTNTLRLSMLVLRTMESAHSCRLQVGVEESMGYIGNRISHKVAKVAVDTFVAVALIPGTYFTFTHHILSLDLWFPVLLCITMGVARAVAPYALSFEGSYIGRVLTKQFFLNAHHRWLPVQRIQHLKAENSQGQDETPTNAPLFDLGRKVAMALAKVQNNVGLDNGMKRQNAASLTEQGFRLVGFGSGGYAVYESYIAAVQHNVSQSSSTGDVLQPVLLHVTPYGPSMLDVLPHYLVLEMENSQDRRAVWSETIAARRWAGPSVVEGFAYRGGFFSPHNFAEMKEAYDDMLKVYDRACSAIPDPKTGPSVSPPMDKASLEKFLNTGEVKRQQRQKKNEDQALQEQVANITKKLQSMLNSENGCLAPQGVILYLEGLSCSRKSSTGGLILQALADAGYQVESRHYNSPPTEEQNSQPWMNRFEVPPTSSLPYDGGEGGGMDSKNTSEIKGECTGDQPTAMVWKHGPAGDFVYGALGEAPESEKCDRYREFMEFDHECFKKNILFIKLLFVTNRDSISSLIGKRLGKQSAIQDLHKWLTASYGVERANEVLKGFDLRDMFNDPTDFVAFNTYQSTLSKFASFALNTDNGCNPWLVVDTADHFLAGTKLLNVFDAQVDAYARVRHHKTTGLSCCRGLFCSGDAAEPVDKFGSFGIDVSVRVVKADQRMKMGGVIALSIVLIYLYLFWLD